MMRSGVTEAARVQYYCAIALCNVLSASNLKEAFSGGSDSLWLQDLIAITVLRVNEVPTKEILARALFNLLSRADTRRMAVERDTRFSCNNIARTATIAALHCCVSSQNVTDLTKLQSSEINTMCVKALHNLCCELPAYEKQAHDRDFFKVSNFKTAIMQVL
eukprot:10263-Heterococcus_DN1.PRE.4